ncbi:MAG: MFS transporter, partial [Methanotrichaceae archaeon]|nr:MFS transporter [Methanotrichaceae archaeon]
QQLILFILVLGTLMGALDSTIVILAFPDIAKSLSSNIATTMWIILVYLLILAVTTTPFGRVGDVFGRSRMFNSGFIIFTIGSALCGLSTNIHHLILSRGIQAIGGSLLQANGGAIIADVFPVEERGKAFGYNSMGWTIGSMIGIVLGGMITTYVGWEYIFFINIPIGIAAVLLGLINLKDVKKIEQTLDLGGMALLATSLSLMSYGAVDFAGSGLTSLNLTLMIIGLVIVPIFVSYEIRQESPMIDLRMFSERVLRYSLLAAFFMSLGYLSVVFLVIMYLQGVRGLSPLDASLLLIPGYVVGSLLSPMMGRLSDRYGARIIATSGIIVVEIAVLLYMTLRMNSAPYVVLIASTVSGFGTSMFFPANNSAVMKRAHGGSYGSLSGLLRTLQNIGVLGSFVIAISVASAAVPRSVAFDIFIGTTNLTGSIASEFIIGIDSALTVSFILLAIAGAMSFVRGKDKLSDY